MTMLSVLSSTANPPLYIHTYIHLRNTSSPRDLCYKDQTRVKPKEVKRVTSSRFPEKTTLRQSTIPRN